MNTQCTGPVGCGLETNFSKLSTDDCVMLLIAFMKGLPWCVPNLTITGLQKLKTDLAGAIYCCRQNPSAENRCLPAILELQLELCIRRSDEIYRQTY